MAIITWTTFFGLLLLLVWQSIRKGILPDKITVGGMFTGLVLSAIYPELHHQPSPQTGFAMSLGGIIVGYLTSWLFCESGKRFFGTTTVQTLRSEPFELEISEQGYSLRFGARTAQFDTIFSRFSDRIEFKNGTFVIETTEPLEQIDGSNVRLSHDALWVDNHRISLGEVKRFEGVADAIRFPREFFGFGIVKMTGFIGAFIGWGAPLIFVGGLTLTFLVTALYRVSSHQKDSSATIEVAPFLAIATAIYTTHFFYS